MSKTIEDHAMMLQINYDQSSPFYKMINMREFWDKPVEYKTQVEKLLPIDIVEHIVELCKKDEL